MNTPRPAVSAVPLAKCPAPSGELTLVLRHSGVDVSVTFRQRADGRVAWRCRPNRATTAMGNAPTLFSAIDAARDYLQITDEELEEFLSDDEPRLVSLLEASKKQAAYRREVGR